MGISMSILSAGSLEVGRFFVDCLHESNDWMNVLFFLWDIIWDYHGTMRIEHDITNKSGVVNRMGTFSFSLGLFS